MRLKILGEKSISALSTGESFPGHLRRTLAHTDTALRSTYPNVPGSTLYKNQTLFTSQILQYQFPQTIQFHSVYSLLFPL
jgi:hypothetical protein